MKLLALRYFRHFFATNIERISPFCRLAIFKNGTLNIGHNCQFEAGCDIQVHGNGKLVIGDKVYMNRYCMISVHGSVVIGKNCIFGPSVKVFDNNHRFNREDGASADLSVGSVIIGCNCWIASNAVLLKGTEIGDNCIIGAGSVINGKIPAGSIVRPNVNYNIESIRTN